MSSLVPSDRTILDLLRQREPMTVADFEQSLRVTATAVRQRLNRLLDQGYIQRHKDESASGRGRPSHWYRLTSLGRRKTGTNFADLALVLWEELRAISDDNLRRGLLQRIAGRMAAAYRDQIQAPGLMERLQKLAGLFSDRQIPFEVTGGAGQLPVLTALACPYPDLAEQDRSICAMERLFFAELLGQRVTLENCRLDGQACCTFQFHPTKHAETVSAVEV
jgi:predicted ArsR family transcriptional regulator